jgi:hypothetical protein
MSFLNRVKYRNKDGEGRTLRYNAYISIVYVQKCLKNLAFLLSGYSFGLQLNVVDDDNDSEMTICLLAWD